LKGGRRLNTKDGVKRPLPNNGYGADKFEQSFPRTAEETTAEAGGVAVLAHAPIIRNPEMWDQEKFRKVAAARQVVQQQPDIDNGVKNTTNRVCRYVRPRDDDISEAVFAKHFGRFVHQPSMRMHQHFVQMIRPDC
jgi:hypothetical protein